MVSGVICTDASVAFPLFLLFIAFSACNATVSSTRGVPWYRSTSIRYGPAAGGLIGTVRVYGVMTVGHAVPVAGITVNICTTSTASWVCKITGSLGHPSE